MNRILPESKKIVSNLLIAIGLIGYAVAAYYLCYAVYFLVIGETHPNAPEDSSAGFAGLGFALAAGIGIVIASIATAFFRPGMALRGSIKAAANKSQAAQSPALQNGLVKSSRQNKN